MMLIAAMDARQTTTLFIKTSLIFFLPELPGYSFLTNPMTSITLNSWLPRLYFLRAVTKTQVMLAKRLAMRHKES